MHSGFSFRIWISLESSPFVHFGASAQLFELPIFVSGHSLSKTIHPWMLSDENNKFPELSSAPCLSSTRAPVRSPPAPLGLCRFWMLSSDHYNSIQSCPIELKCLSPLLPRIPPNWIWLSFCLFFVPYGFGLDVFTFNFLLGYSRYYTQTAPRSVPSTPNFFQNFVGLLTPATISIILIFS